MLILSFAGGLKLVRQNSEALADRDACNQETSPRMRHTREPKTQFGSLLLHLLPMLRCQGIDHTAHLLCSFLHWHEPVPYQNKAQAEACVLLSDIKRFRQ
jgi:hypothetical protein